MQFFTMQFFTMQFFTMQFCTMQFCTDAILLRASAYFSLPFKGRAGVGMGTASEF